MQTTHEITELLVAWGEGDQEALDRLVTLVEAHLRRMARRRLANERPGHILQTTALVNEAYLRLIDWKNMNCQNRAQFFGAAATIMRRILVDYAVRQRIRYVPLEEAAALSIERNLDWVALNAALDRLAVLEPRQCTVFELYFFDGMSRDEITEALGVSLGTVKRDLTLAKLWLLGEMGGKRDDDA